VSRILTTDSGRKIALCPDSRSLSLSNSPVCCGDRPPCEIANTFYRADPCPDTVAGVNPFCDAKTLYFACETPLEQPVVVPGRGTAITLDQLIRLRRSIFNPPIPEPTILFNGNCYTIQGGIYVRCNNELYFGTQCVGSPIFEPQLRLPDFVTDVTTPLGCVDPRCQPFGNVILAKRCGGEDDARLAVCASEISKCVTVRMEDLAGLAGGAQFSGEQACVYFQPGPGVPPPPGVVILQADLLENRYRTCCECIGDLLPPFDTCDTRSLVEWDEVKGQFNNTGEQCCCPENYTAIVTEFYEDVIPCGEGFAPGSTASRRFDVNGSYVIQYVNGSRINSPTPPDFVTTECFGSPGAPPCGDCTSSSLPGNVVDADCTGRPTNAPFGVGNRVFSCQNFGLTPGDNCSESFSVQHACGLWRYINTVNVNNDGFIRNIRYEFKIQVVDRDLPPECKDSCKLPGIIPPDGFVPGPIDVPENLNPGKVSDFDLPLPIRVRSSGCGGCGKGGGL
jgi:hypothetical protein